MTQARSTFFLIVGAGGSHAEGSAVVEARDRDGVGAPKVDRALSR
jgi:hypothetical protein